jgi:hypothetical protein
VSQCGHSITCSFNSSRIARREGMQRQRVAEGQETYCAKVRHTPPHGAVDEVNFLCCRLFNQGVKLTANLIDPLPQLLMPRLVRGGVTSCGEILAIVLRDVGKLTLESFHSVGKILIVHYQLRRRKKRAATMMITTTTAISIQCVSVIMPPI